MCYNLRLHVPKQKPIARMSMTISKLTEMGT